MIDKIAGPPTPLEGAHCTFCRSKEYAAYMAAPRPAKPAGKPVAPDPTRKLRDELGKASSTKVLVGQIAADRILCYRALAASPSADPALLAWWRRSLPIVADEDRAGFRAECHRRRRPCLDF